MRIWDDHRSVQEGEVNKILANLFMLVLIWVNGVVVMMYGWGIDPVSWWVIGGCGFFAAIIFRMGDLLRQESDK